jgi:hypothetical protein
LKPSRVSVHAFVAAVLVASATVAITLPAVGASPARPPSIPAASLWAINETMQTYGIRTISLPPTYIFASWHQQSSNVPEHRGRDMVVEFSRGGLLAATWTATRVYPHQLSRCGNLYGPSRTRLTVRAKAVYAVSHPYGSIAWMCVTDTPYYPMVYRLWSDHGLSPNQLASIVGMSRYRYVYTVSPFIDFWTPTRNIGCVASIPGQGLDPGGIDCYVRSGLRPTPTHRPSVCRGAVFGWGNVVSLELPAAGPAIGRSQYSCADYEPVDTSARTLEYGHEIRAFGVTCNSMPIGLRCSNAKGHGFFLSRQHSYLF